MPSSNASKYARTSSVSLVITSISLVLRHFPAHGFHERLHVLRPVVNLVVDLAVRQQPPVTVGLQCPLADAQFLAHVRPVHPVHLFGRAVAGAKLPHVLREAAEPFLHLLEGLSLDAYYFHCPDTFLWLYFPANIPVCICPCIKTVPLVLVLLHVCSLVTFRAVKSREKLYISARPSAYFPPFPLAVCRTFRIFVTDQTSSLWKRLSLSLNTPSLPLLRSSRRRAASWARSHAACVASTSSVSRTTASSISFWRPVPATRSISPGAAGTSSARPTSTAA